MPEALNLVDDRRPERRERAAQLLEALEEQARQWGLPQIKLISTSKARTFYEEFGYLQDGDPVPGRGSVIDYNYIKRVQPTPDAEPRQCGVAASGSKE